MSILIKTVRISGFRGLENIEVLLERTTLPTEIFTEVDIMAGQTMEKTAKFSVGFLKVTASKDGKPFNTPVELYKLNGEKYYTHWISNGVRTFNLLPGTYNVKVLDIQEKSKTKIFDGIKVEGRKTESINVAF